jgi:hypothetical protein
VISDSIKKLLRPRRSIPGTSTPVTIASAERLLKKIREGYCNKKAFSYPDTTYATIYGAGLECAAEPKLLPRRKSAHALLLDPTLDAIRAADIETLAFAQEMLAHTWRELTLLPAIATARSIGDAVRVALRRVDLKIGSDGNYTKTRYVLTEEKPAIGSHGDPWPDVRNAVCAADDKTYAAAVKEAAAIRKELDLPRRALVAYAFPDEPWADADLVAAAATVASATREHRFEHLFSAVSSFDALEKFLATPKASDHLSFYALDLVQVMPEKSMIPVLAAQLPSLLEKPKYGPLLKTPPRVVIDSIACYQSPAAAKVLAEYVSHPVLAPNVLAFFRDAPELGDALEGKGGARLAPSIERVRGKNASEKKTKPAREAKAKDLPPVLRDRSWRPRDGGGKRAVLALEMRGIDREKVVLPGPQRAFEDNDRDVFRAPTKAELAKWRKEIADDGYAHADYGGGWQQGKNPHYEYWRVPDKEGIEVWNTGDVGIHMSPLQWVARHGTKVLEGFTKRDWLKWLAWDYETDNFDAIMSFISPRVAPDLARAAGRKRTRRRAHAWLEQNAEIAALGLIPNALGKEGAAQTEATEALRFLAQKGKSAAVKKAASAYGKDGARLVTELLARDPLAIDVAPPKPPAFLRVGDLPDVLLRSKRSIGAEGRAALVEMLQVTSLDPPYPGVEIVKVACAAESLGALALELVEQWLLGDAPGRHEWMLHACVHFQSDAATRRVTGLAREWARKDQAKAKRACVALAALGTDAALMVLSHVAETTRYDALKKEAGALVLEAAAARDLTIDELGDRTVPDVGLDAKGGLELSYGARTFLVSLDESLSPVVREKTKDGLGASARSLPRPTKNDDATSANASRERFDALKKDLAAIAQRQLRRLERAMVDGRVWSAADFSTYLSSHPLLVHLARRLVWEALAKGKAPRAFRVAEDGTFADEDDRAFKLDPRAEVRLAHPVRDASAIAAFSKVFSDYEIIQPFAQLGRATFAMEKSERIAMEIVRTARVATQAKKTLGVLESRGWRRVDAGSIGHFTRVVRDTKGGALTAHLKCTPDVSIGEDRRLDAEQKTEAAMIERDGQRVKVGELDAASFSEIINDALALGAKK